MCFLLLCNVIWEAEVLYFKLLIELVFMKKKILFVLLLLFSYIGGLITSYYFSLYRYKEIYKSEIARLSVGYDLEVKNAAEKEVTDIEIFGEKEIKVQRHEP